MNEYNETMGGVVVTPAQWEQRRYEIAKEMLPVLYNRVLYTLSGGATVDGRQVSIEQRQGITAAAAIEYADALIKELKGDER